MKFLDEFYYHLNLILINDGSSTGTWPGGNTLLLSFGSGGTTLRPARINVHVLL